jgi:hypothetical protein
MKGYDELEIRRATVLALVCLAQPFDLQVAFPSPLLSAAVDGINHLMPQHRLLNTHGTIPLFCLNTHLCVPSFAYAERGVEFIRVSSLV